MAMFKKKKKQERTERVVLHIKDDPKVSEYLYALDILGIDEKTLKKDPQAAIRSINGMTVERCKDLLDVILERKINVKQLTVDMHISLTAYATAVFLANSLKRQLSENITGSELPENRALRILKLSAVTDAMMLSEKKVRPDVYNQVEK